MSDTITASGNTREIQSISSGDLIINGDFTADEIFGSGKNIKNISIDNIILGQLNKPLSKSLGGTGNNIYQDNGIIFNDVSNDNNKLNTTYKLKWENTTDTLLINQRDFITDNSNYVIYTSNLLINDIMYYNSNILINDIIFTSNLLINDIKESSNLLINDIRYTSNLLINDIKESSNIISSNMKSYFGNNFATPSNHGVVKIGEGLFVNNSGVISIFQENIDIVPPVIIPHIIHEQIYNGVLKKVIFTYNPMRGTIFDNEKTTDNTFIIGKVLPFWYNFNNDLDKSINSGNMNNSIDNSIVLHGQNNHVTYKPNNKTDLFFEYTPLNTSYLYLNGNNNAYASFKNNVQLEKIYGKGDIGGDSEGITICFWFKIENESGPSVVDKKSLLYFSSEVSSEVSSEENNPSYYIDINVQNNNILTVSLFNLEGIHYSIYDVSLCNNTWKHFIWSISKDGLWNIYINGDEKKRDNTKTYEEDPVKIINSSQNILEVAILKLDSINANYINKYIGKSSIINNTFLKFSISDIRLYNRELINSEIIELYNANNYTKYEIEFKDTNNNTTCNILLIGGGGGGNIYGAGGSSGELKYIESIIRESKHIILVGRGGRGRNIGSNSSFGSIISHGGGSGNITNNNIIDDIVPTSIFYNTTIITKQQNRHIDLNGIGTGGGGGGGSGTEGTSLNGGDGIYDINENQISVNFKTLFDLDINENIGEYNEEDGEIYFAGGGGSEIGGKGGGGKGSLIYNQNIKYNGTNGSGGGGYDNQHAFGGDGIVILKYSKKIIPKTTIMDNILDTSNYILDTSNILIMKIENLLSRIAALESP